MLINPSDLKFIIGSSIAIASLIAYIFFERKKYRLDFLLQKFHENVKKPIESDWSIRILHPNMRIEKCSILCNDIQCPWWDSYESYYEKTILAGGGGNVRIPKGSEKENAEITVKNGKKTLKKIKFKDISPATR